MQNINKPQAKRKETPAQHIKKELLQVFTGVKFSCKYDKFSMWDSVDVS